VASQGLPAITSGIKHCDSQQADSVSSTVKVGISGYGNLQTMSTDEWATSKCTQLSTKIWVKLLLLFENALKLNF